MEYKIEDKPKSQKSINVVVPVDRIKEQLEKAAKNLSLNSKIKGFRPGNAPLKVVQEMMGEKVVWEEASYQVIDDTYREIVKKENIDVISSPKISIEKMEPGKDLSYKALVPIFPIVTLPDYREKARKSLKEKKKIDVIDSEVDEAISLIRKSRAKTVRVSRESKNGDEVIINFQGKIDGVEQEGLKGEKFPIVIGETKFIEGFNKEITGVKEGEKKTFSLKMPLLETEKPVDFSIEILAVNERELPEIDDDFAKSIGKFSGVKDLKNKVRENIKIEKERKEKEKNRIKIIEAISEDSSAEIPDVLISREVENMLNEVKERYSKNRGLFEEELKKSGKTEEDLKNEWKDQAEKRIMVSLILQEIARKEDINTSDEDLEIEVEAYLSRISDGGKGINRDQLKIHIKDIIQNNKTFELLESL